jgi:hypothetical protein
MAKLKKVGPARRGQKRRRQRPPESIFNPWAAKLTALVRRPDAGITPDPLKGEPRWTVTRYNRSPPLSAHPGYPYSILQKSRLQKAAGTKIPSKFNLTTIQLFNNITRNALTRNP